MASQLPPFVFDILPPVYVAFTRVLGRFQVSAGELLSLRLLRNATVTIDDRKVLLLTDLIDGIGTGMGYAQAGAASEVLRKLSDKGYIEKKTLATAQREEYFPTGSRRSAVFLNASGNRLYEDICLELEKSAGDFFRDLSQEVQDQFGGLFDATSQYRGLVPVLETAFLTGPESEERPAGDRVASDEAPDSETRFMAACKKYLGGDFLDGEGSFASWFDRHIPTLLPEQREAFLGELDRSVAATPLGLQRRSSAQINSDAEKLLSFLDNLIHKYRDA